MGVPVLVALIAGTGVAAMGVRMFLVRRAGSTAAHAAGDPGLEPGPDADLDPLDDERPTAVYSGT
jgi:hypothetical protein